MSVTQKVDLLTGSGGSSYVGFIPAIGSLCIPTMNLEDGPAGVGDGMSNVTQLPAPVDVAPPLPPPDWVRVPLAVAPRVGNSPAWVSRTSAVAAR